MVYLNYFQEQMPHATQAYEKMGSLLHYLHKNAQVENKELEFTTSLGRVFHSAIVLGKKENLKVSIMAIGTLYLKTRLRHVSNS